MRKVAFVTNDNIIMATMVAITSFIENNKDGWVIYLFYIKNNLSTTNIKLIENVCIRSSVEISFVEVESDLLSDYTFTDRIGYETYVRLLFPSLLVDVDKILYLDVDIVVNGSLSSLYDLDISDYYLAGVPDISDPNDNERIIGELGHKLSHTYFNSGVLLLNLNKFREDDIESQSKILSKEKRGLIVREDQDILNYLCDSVLIVNHTYNLQGESLKDYNVLIGSGIVRTDELITAFSNPVIYHYVITLRKPWSITCLRPSIRLWFHYLNQTCFKNFKIPFSCKYLFGGYFYRDLMYLKRHKTISDILKWPYLYLMIRINNKC